MEQKISLIIISISILTSMLFGIDRITSENPSDSATLRISLSDRDSSYCDECTEGGIFYESGCKRCVQDGIMFGVGSIEQIEYNVGWSNNDAMYHGDKNCEGNSKFENKNTDDVFWVEIIRDELELETILYSDQKYTEKIDSLSMKMCSSPTDLKYLRVSNDDGKPAGNGGKLLGNLDDFEVWNLDNGKKSLLFSTSFENCLEKTCNDEWVLQNSNRVFVDSNEEFLHFDYEVTGTLDYAHLELDEPISDDSWMLRLKVSLDDIQPHPHGKGFLKIEPIFSAYLLVVSFIVFCASIAFLGIKKYKNN